MLLGLAAGHQDLPFRNVHQLQASPHLPSRRRRERREQLVLPRLQLNV
jgi:hypothetical protein